MLERSGGDRNSRRGGRVVVGSGVLEWKRIFRGHQRSPEILHLGQRTAFAIADLGKRRDRWISGCKSSGVGQRDHERNRLGRGVSCLHLEWSGGAARVRCDQRIAPALPLKSAGRHEGTAREIW